MYSMYHSIHVICGNICNCVQSLQMCFSLSFQLMKNFKVEYPEKEPFSVVQNVFLNADRNVPLKFTNV